MRGLAAIVQPPMTGMLDARHRRLFGGLVAAELIRDKHMGDLLAIFEQLTEEFLRCSLVSSAMHQDMEGVAVLIHGARGRAFFR